MSYDLFFCRRETLDLNFEGVASWAMHQHRFQRPAETQLWYQNEDTGVYFSLDYTPASERESGESSVPTGYFDLGLAFNLNYNRPSFFAYEAMPIIEGLASQFSLFVVDPQDPESEGTPKVPQATQLIETWKSSNAEALGVLSGDPELSEQRLYMSEDKSLAFWRYMRRKHEWDIELESEDVFVPKIMLVRKRKSHDVGRLITWAMGVHMLVPDCEWIAIGRPRKGFGKLLKKYDTTYVGSNTVFNSVGGLLEEFVPDGSVKRLRPELVPQVAELLAGIPAEISKDDFEGVAPDGFVDREAPEAPSPLAV
ncbi:MAG TPA: hypothetical protein VLE48_08180 [Terriglobales bacterium]|nr:hypothetical protein [Terriglobales bacterium]